MPIVAKSKSPRPSVKPVPAGTRRRPTTPDVGPSTTASPVQPNRDADGNYLVGKYRPPVSAQFKPGQSGNPSGRRKRKKGADFNELIVALMEDTIAVRNAAGRQIKVMRSEALMLTNYEKAVKGDIRATKLVFDLYGKAKSAKAGDSPRDDSLAPAEMEMLKAMVGGFAAGFSAEDAS